MDDVSAVIEPEMRIIDTFVFDKYDNSVNSTQGSSTLSEAIYYAENPNPFSQFTLTGTDSRCQEVRAN